MEKIPHMNELTVEAPINVPAEQLWELYTNPQHITQWNHASEDWHCPSAKNDVQEHGEFSFRMEPRTGPGGFDFKGMYTEVVPGERLAYTMEDGRRATVEFMPMGNSTHLRITFEPEKENTDDLQTSGWQAILDNFKTYAESYRS